MRAIIKDMHLAPLTEFARDAGCKRVSFYADHKSLKVLASTPDASVLLNASVPADVMEPGGFALGAHKLDMFMHYGDTEADLSYEDGIVRSDYGCCHASEDAAPFANKRHAAKRLPVEYDAQALVAVKHVVRILWDHNDHKQVKMRAADGRLLINGLSAGGAEGEAAGTYAWQKLANIMHHMQDLTRVSIRLQDRGPIVLTFLGPPDVALCIRHK